MMNQLRFLGKSIAREVDWEAVKDQPAVLFRDYLLLVDLSGATRQWNPWRYKFDNRDPEALYLTWETNERTFDIAIKSRDISEKELIRLAESIP